MNKTLAISIGGLLILLLLLFFTTYTVKYNEVAIKRTFGETDADSVIRDAGLHFKWPIVDQVEALDTRVQLVESPLEEITTSDNLQLVIGGFLLWQVNTKDDGPRQFIERYGSREAASNLLRGQFRTAMSAALSGYRFQDLLGADSRLEEAERAVRAQLEANLVDSGIETVTVGVSQVVLPAKVTTAVLKRMEATRNALAVRERRNGETEAARLKNDADTVASKITAFATERAGEIQEQGAKDAAQYNAAMGANEDLAIFLVWLDAFQQTLGKNTSFFLPATMAPFHLGDPANVDYVNDIPMPPVSIDDAPADADDAEQGG